MQVIPKRRGRILWAKINQVKNNGTTWIFLGDFKFVWYRHEKIRKESLLWQERNKIKLDASNQRMGEF